MSRRVLLGQLPDGGLGLRISKAGYDVATNPPDPSRLIFDSAWPALLPIHQIGSGTIGSGQQLNIGFPVLPFRPFFVCLVQPSNGNISGVPSEYSEGQIYTTFGSGNVSALYIAVTTSLIGLTWTNTPQAGTPTSWNFAYTIFKIGV